MRLAGWSSVIVMTLAIGIAGVCAAAYAGHYVFTEFARYTMLDMLRAIGGMP